MSDILDFYNGHKVEGCNHVLSDIWTYSFDRLERGHDYIQWMFPLDEPSAHSLEAPILTREDIEAFRSSKVLKWRVMSSVHIFMTFLHFNAARWVCRYDHNQLRITRVLKCLVLFGLENQAKALLEEVMLIVDSVGSEAQDIRAIMARPIEYWESALLPTNPDYEDPDGGGQ